MSKHLKKTTVPKIVLTALFSFSPLWSNAQITVEAYNPSSTLIVPEHIVSAAKYPFIDVHSHQYLRTPQDFQKLKMAMDSLHMKFMINLNGGWGSMLKEAVENIYKNGMSDRLAVFANIDFQGFGFVQWTEYCVNQLKEDVANGAKGLKIFKELGIAYTDIHGNRIPINDPRLDPIWAACGELGIPVLIHSGAPKSFWEPMDEKNERWLELYKYPDRRYANSAIPSWEQLMQEQHDVFAKHPKTIFINAHFGWHANDLAELSAILKKYPNVYIEFGAVIAELGRQPRMAKQFFESHQDRILFGKDSWVPSEYVTYFRVLETADEYFPYHKKYHAFWRMYGMGLSDEVLKKVYYKNALKIIPGIDSSWFEK